MYAYAPTYLSNLLGQARGRMKGLDITQGYKCKTQRKENHKERCIDGVIEKNQDTVVLTDSPG